MIDTKSPSFELRIFFIPFYQLIQKQPAKHTEVRAIYWLISLHHAMLNSFYVIIISY